MEVNYLRYHQLSKKNELEKLLDLSILRKIALEYDSRVFDKILRINNLLNKMTDADIFEIITKSYDKFDLLIQLKPEKVSTDLFTKLLESNNVSIFIRILQSDDLKMNFWRKIYPTFDIYIGSLNNKIKQTPTIPLSKEEGLFVSLYSSFRKDDLPRI